MVIGDADKRQWGPLERGVRHLALDLDEPRTKVLLAVAAYADEGPAELLPVQIARRSGVDLERIPGILADLVRCGPLDLSAARRRSGARTYRPRVTPVPSIERKS